MNSKNFLPNKIFYHQFKKINSEIIQLTPNYNIEYDIPIYIPDIPKYSCFCALDEAREIKKYLKKKEMEKINNNNINIINNFNNSEISINCQPVPNVKHNYCHICKKKYEEYLKHIRCNNHNDCLKKYKKEFNGIKETFKRIAIFYEGEKNYEENINNNLINNLDLNDDDCKKKKKKRKKYKFKNNFIFKRKNKKLIKKENKINNNISLNETIKKNDNFDINNNNIKYEIYSNNFKDSNSEKFLNKKRYQTNNSSLSFNNNNKKKEKELNDKSLADNINENNNNIKKNNKNLLSFIPSKKKNKDSDFSTSPNSLLPAKKKSLILNELICSKKVCKIFKQTEETKCIKGKYFIKKRIDKKEFIFITDIINV